MTWYWRYVRSFWCAAERVIWPLEAFVMRHRAEAVSREFTARHGGAR